LVLVADPDVLAESLSAVHLVVTNSKVIARDPDDRTLGTQGIMLEGSLDKLITFVGREIL
jgi:hypothetical protein